MNDGQLPLVSIVITSYNRAAWIGEAIQSALDQDYPNLEIIVSDNHSTDDSDTIIKKFTSDTRVKYFVNEVNIGMIPNFKLATEERASGKYLAYISSDDYLASETFISDAVNLINKYPDVVLVAAKNATLFNEVDKLEPHDSDHIYQHEFLKGREMFEKFPEWLLPGWGGVVMHREKLVATDAFSSRAQSLDYEANLKLTFHGNVAFIKKTSYVFRKHASNASGYMSYEANVKNLDFIENTYEYAKKINSGIDLDEWRLKLYKAYLNTNCTQLLKSEKEFDQLVNYVKTEKKIDLGLFSAPRLVINSFIYRHHRKFTFLLKAFYPQKYHAIQKLLY